MTPPVKVNGRYRLSTANHPGKCRKCGRPYPKGVEIERLPAGGFAGPCCLTPAPSDTAWMGGTR